MFKNAYSLAIRFVFAPDKSWQIVSNRKYNKAPHYFLFPLWSIIVLFAFIGNYFLRENGSFEAGIKMAIIEVISLLGSFYISGFILNEYVSTLKPQIKDRKKAQSFIAYGSALMYLIYIFVAMFKDFFFLWLFSFYTLYIVSVGADIFYKIDAKNRTNFSVIATILIVAMPLIIKYSLSLIVK